MAERKRIIIEQYELALVPRRDGKISISWTAGSLGHVSLDRVHWASVEWSPVRQHWYIGDCVGLIRGAAKSKKDAVALAAVMIRDGRMPMPEEARREAAERRRTEWEKRAKKPPEQKGRTHRRASDEGPLPSG